MKKRWALITAAMGAFVCVHVIATSAQEIPNRQNTLAVLALESERAPIPLAATGSADQSQRYTMLMFPRRAAVASHTRISTGMVWRK